ncbi:hypothetical protein C0992_011404 [Termitomyces sp. T32_za158]|nr:hypothetical protein C0992_011404 [Termitomyces sp. T32_za158]
MSRGRCPAVENYLRQGKIRRATDGKVVLPSGAVIPNYPDLKTFQERVDEWHRRNPNNIATATLTGNANPDAEQALQQQLIQEILPTSQSTVQPTTIHATLTRQEMINNLEQRLQALKNQTFDRVEICQPKQAPKGYKPMASAAAPATAPAPAVKSTAPAAPVTVPDPVASTAPTDHSVPAQPPLHPYSGIPNRYAPPAQKNFAAPDKRQEGPYRPTAPVYDIEKSNHVFSRIMKSAVTLSVEELCSIAPDVRNQMKTAVTPKRTMQATVQDADDIDDALPGFALTALLSHRGITNVRVLRCSGTRLVTCRTFPAESAAV